MERHDIERLRRSVAMLPPGHARGALPLTKDQAMELVDELARLDRLTARYREVIGQLRRLLEEADQAEGSPSPP